MLKSARRLVLAFAIAVLPAAMASAQPANIVDTWVAEINATPNLVAGYEALSVVGDAVTVVGFTISDRLFEYAIEFETMTITGYRELPPTGYAIRGLTIDHGRARFENADVEIRDFSLRNLTVPEGEFLFVPERPFSSVIDIIAQATLISLDELRVGRLDLLQDQGGLNALVTYFNYVVTGLEGGRIASAVVGPIVLESPWPDSLLTMTVERVETEGIDYNAIVHAFDADRYAGGRGDNQWMTLVGRTTYSNILLGAPDLQMRIRTIEAENFTLRQSDQPIEAALDMLLGGTDLAPDVAERLGERLLIDALTAPGIGRLAFTDIDIFANDLPRFHLGDIHIDNLSLDGLDEFGFADLDVVLEDGGFVAIDHFAIGGIGLPKRELLRAVVFAVAEGEEIPDIFAITPTIEYIEIAGVEIGAPGALPIAIEAAQLRLSGYMGALATAYTMEIRGFGAPVTLLDEDTRRFLNRLGYTDATGDFTVDVVWDRATETLAISNLYFALTGAGSIRASLEIAGVTREMLVNPEAMAGVGADELLLVRAEILVTDETLADRLFQQAAEGAGLPPAQFRDEFIRGLPFVIQFAGVSPTIVQQVAPPLQEFLRQPGTLSIVINPPQPIDFETLAEILAEAPTRALQILGVEITPVPRAPN